MVAALQIRDDDFESGLSSPLEFAPMPQPDTDENDLPEMSGIKGMIQQLAKHQRDSARRQEMALDEIKGNVAKLGERLTGFGERIAQNEERWVNHKEQWLALVEKEIPALHARMSSIENALGSAAAARQHEADVAGRELDAVRSRINAIGEKASKGEEAHDTITGWRNQWKVPLALGTLLAGVLASILTWWGVTTISSLEARLSGMKPAAVHVEPPAVEVHAGDGEGGGHH